MGLAENDFICLSSGKPQIKFLFFSGQPTKRGLSTKKKIELFSNVFCLFFSL